MFHSRRAVVPACFVFVVAGFLCSLVKLIAAEKLPKTTALDDYINKPDDSYRWELVSEQNVNGMKLVVIDMVSQSWRTPDDVNRTP